MKVLLTGGGGFLGAWIIRRLVASGIDVRVFDTSENRSLITQFAGVSAHRLEWHIGDIV